MRRGELLALRRGEIRGNVAILRGTKNGKDRAVPLSSRALAVLAELPASIDGRVFPIGEDSLEYYWRKARDLAGCVKPDPLRLHDLRHEATSRLFERGLQPFEVLSITGHSGAGNKHGDGEDKRSHGCFTTRWRSTWPGATMPTLTPPT